MGPDSGTSTTFVALGSVEIWAPIVPILMTKKVLTFVLTNTSKVACFVLNNAAERAPFLTDPRHVPMGDANLDLDTCVIPGLNKACFLNVLYCT